MGVVNDQLQALYDSLLEQKKERAVVSISNIKTSTWLEITNTAKLSYRTATLSASAAKETAAEFVWDDRVERAQADRASSVLVAGTWVDAANLNPYLLSYDGLETLGRTFRGTTDVVVADRVAVRTRCPQMGLRVLFKLKKAITDSDVVPARARVLLANLHSPDNRPVMVLTDLRDEWHMLWLDGSIIFYTAFESRGDAAKYIEDVLAGCVDAYAAEGSDDVRFAKRHKIDDRLAGCVDAYAAEESDDVKFAKRRKIDDSLAHAAGASDSFGEQLESLQGSLPETELMQMRVQRLLRLLETSPAAPSWGPPPPGM